MPAVARGDADGGFVHHCSARRLTTDLTFTCLIVKRLLNNGQRGAKVLPLKSGKQTGRERVFVERMAATNDKRYAAEAAGWAFPAIAANKALARPAIAAEIRAAQLARLNNELLPLAINVLQDVLTSTTSTERGKIMAAKIVIDKTTGADEAAEAKEPHEMTADELQRRIDQLRREAAERARPVLDVEPVKPAAAGVFD